MEAIWHPGSLIEGQMARQRLQSEGVRCHLAGEHLGGAVGELPALGLYTLMVDPAQREQALALLVEWGLIDPAPEDELDA